MARNMYGATSADFTLTSGGRVVPGATLTIWSARTGGTQITDLLDRDSVAATTVTSGADGSVVYYGPNNDKTVHWADSGQGARIAIRPVDITGDPPVLSIGTVTTGTAAASLTGTSEAPVLNLTLPTAGANGVDTAAIQSKAVTAAKIADDTITAAQIAANAVGASELADNAVTPAKMATSGRFTFPTGAANGYGFTSGASHLSGTGSPEGVVTAAPGSTFLQTDSTVDVKGWIRWIKATGTGNTGWVAGPEADTGWRTIDYTTGTANWTAGTLRLRRVGSVVHVGLVDVKMAALNSAIYTVPTGFVNQISSTPSAVVRESVSTSNPYWFTVSAGQVCRYGAALSGSFSAAYGFNGTFMFLTADAWPTSNPGSPA